MRFCPDCGASLDLRYVEGRQRAFCPRCRRVHYAQLKVGAAAFIEDDGKLLLLRRGDEPFKASWNLPAGYAEADEAPVDTVVREVFEETGLSVEPERLVAVYYFDDDPRGNGILVIYACRRVGGALRATSEGAPDFFAPDEIPSDLAGGGHDQAIGAWQGSRPTIASRRLGPVTGFHYRELPGHSTLLAGREPPDAVGYKTRRLQIWYNNQNTSWVNGGERPHKHMQSDECFVVLRGTLTVEVSGEQLRVGPREFCCFPSGVYHAIVDVHPPVETLMIRAPSVEDKVYRGEGGQGSGPAE